MVIITKISFTKVLIIFIIMILILIGITLFVKPDAIKVSSHDSSIDDDNITETHIAELFDIRTSAYLNEDEQLLNSLYNTETRNGQWAYEHEYIKMTYINQWADKQEVQFKNIDSYIATRRIDEVEKDRYSAVLAVSTEYTYSYVDEVDIETSFRIGSYHNMEFVKENGNWVINKEWYGDPFGGYLQLDDVDRVKDIISSGVVPEYSEINERRVGAIEYANKHSGVAMPPDYSFHYNNEYRNYNGHGGDCTNFASQVLFEGGDFPKNGTWNYKDGEATVAWVRAGSFHSYMLYSGRASLIAVGNYEDVLEHSYNLMPGDYIAYERKGKVAHISIVTDFDNKGYPLVNSHNTDRYKVPWDVGWSTKDVKINLVRVHY